jgi:hypothetical protein
VKFQQFKRAHTLLRRLRATIIAPMVMVVFVAMSSSPAFAASGYPTGSSTGTSGQMVFGGMVIPGKFDANGRPVLQAAGTSLVTPNSPVHAPGPCGNVDMYFARDGEFRLILNSKLAVSVGHWAVYSDGLLEVGASGFYSTVTGYYSKIGQIYPGFGAHGMGTDGWVVLSDNEYCYWPGGGQSGFGYWYN